MLFDLNMEGFVLYVPNTRVKKIACYISLALGLKEIVCYMSLALGLIGRIRRSEIGVFPRRSCVLYVPSTRVQKESCVPYVPGTRVKREIVACHTSLAQGLGSSFVLYVPSTRVQRDSCVPYVPGTRVKRCCMPYVPSKRVKEVLCYMPLAQGSKGSYALYVPSTRVHE